ncbi:MAG: hypothetical protein LBQ13_01565 [Endomicrobium sp.]|jgi:cellulose biosynthesis protein BcsQ|nr:hypothetical protein [Endomicrobium sp.]
MRVVIFNLKGGQGKTSLAINLALTLNAGVVTNDVYSPLEKILSDNQFLKIGMDEEYPEIVEDNMLVIYDLGGWIDRRSIKLFKAADLIIIPVINDFINNQVSINTIEEVRKHSDKILIVANRTEKNDYLEIKSIMDGFYKNDKYPILEIKKTTAFSKIFEKGKSINNIIAEDKLLAFSYREVQRQMQSIVDFIKNI